MKHTIFRCESSQAVANYNCLESFDGIVLTNDNGWANNGVIPSWVVFYLDTSATANTLIIKSGVARTDHYLTDFKIDLMVGCGYQAATGVSVNNDDAIISGPRVQLPYGYERLRISFDQLENVNAVKLTAFGSDRSDHRAILTEVFLLDVDIGCTLCNQYIDLIMDII